MFPKHSLTVVLVQKCQSFATYSHCRLQRPAPQFTETKPRGRIKCQTIFIPYILNFGQRDSVLYLYNFRTLLKISPTTIEKLNHEENDIYKPKFKPYENRFRVNLTYFLSVKIHVLGCIFQHILYVEQLYSCLNDLNDTQSHRYTHRHTSHIHIH